MLILNPSDKCKNSATDSKQKQMQIFYSFLGIFAQPPTSRIHFVYKLHLLNRPMIKLNLGIGALV